MKITLIAGARPNFIKIAPIIKAIKKSYIASQNIKYRLVHTGQHYDIQMSSTFFKELNIPQPEVNLNCGGGTQAEQTGAIMVAIEKELMTNPTDLVLVVGDVTGTMACSIVAKKLQIKIAHVEAGLRSSDLTMPEEINRIVTDSITDYFFTTTKLASNNLTKEGVDKQRIFFVGNVMIDTLLDNRNRFNPPIFWKEKKLFKNQYLVLTLHRPSNVDAKSKLENIIQEIVDNCNNVPIIFPAHPRTAKILENSVFSSTNLHLVNPLGYLEFNYLVENSLGVITDSGGITEETTVMGVPCITLRNSTERPETVQIGTNELIGSDILTIRPTLAKLFSGRWKKGNIPELWDGKTSERIIKHLFEIHA